MLSHLGLARRAGALAIGVGAARDAVRDGRARLVVLAEDGAAGQRAKVEAIAQARDVPIRVVASAAMLGASVGVGAATAVAVTDAGLAKAAAAAIDKSSISDRPGRTAESSSSSE